MDSKAEEGHYGYDLYRRTGLKAGSMYPILMRLAEYLQHRGDHLMNNLTSSFVVSALIGLALVLPFIVLDFTYNPSSWRNLTDQIVLFGLLWFLAAAFTFILSSIVRTWREGGSLMASPVNLLFRIAFLALIAVMWGGIISDQLPCFLGVPNCD
ncbi:MAG: hypothetical protein IPM66_16430 [Acidobacteriota bacterium]|nr:MAG: hypothetical protein IPM66_16430 [Acidobacteriota bacterium]